MLFLHTKGRKIVGENGQNCFLRGVCLGSWLNMESFMTGHMGTHSVMSNAIERELGAEAARAFFEGFLDNFVTEEDFALLEKLGANCVRIAVNYRHLESDDAPGEYLEDGFAYLDRAIHWAECHGIYVIIDMHALPGWQNRRWHSDNPHGAALLFSNRDYWQRTVELWRHIALRYKDEPTVAGYDLMNEPEAGDVEQLCECYADIIDAIRSTGDRHIIFLEGNDRGVDFCGMDRLIGEDIAFSSHNYNFITLNSRAYPGTLLGKHTDRRALEASFEQHSRWILDREVVSWIGEFSTIFDGPFDQPTHADLARVAALDDQLKLFNDRGQNWTIWSYKDIGYVGLVVPDPQSEYIKRVRPIVEIKNRLSLDCFISRRHGGVFRTAQSLIDETAELVGRTLGDFSLDYNSLIKTIGEEALSASLSSFLSPLYAHAFADMTPDEIREMMAQAFKLPNARVRPSLYQVLSRAFIK